jgi:hypothetical protein
MNCFCHQRLTLLSWHAWTEFLSVDSAYPCEFHNDEYYPSFLQMIMQNSILALVINADKTPSRSLATSVKLSHFSWQEPMSWDMESTPAMWVLQNHWSSQNCTQVYKLQSQQELHGLYSAGSSSAQHIHCDVRKFVCRQNENLRDPVPLICDDFCAFYRPVILIDTEWPWGLGSDASVLIPHIDLWKCVICIIIGCDFICFIM